MDEKQKNNDLCVVNSHNEWDPLEEVIVGRLENAHFFPLHFYLRAYIPSQYYDFLSKNAGKSWPKNEVDPAIQDLEEFSKLLEAEGVKVRRPEIVDYSKPFSTPEWRSECGVYSAMPRDMLLVIGNEIIEPPMSWRSRYYEVFAYRKLLKEYFKKGAKWTSAPKPQLNDDLYDKSYEVPKDNQNIDFIITEYEAVFDAADFIRCGRDIFGQKSNVTNSFGIEWLRRHLGEKYTIHEIQSKCKTPIHIDTTLVPLAPGVMLYNPKFVDKDKLPDILDKWDIFEAPEPNIPPGTGFPMSSTWISMNILNIDEKKIIVEKYQKNLIKFLEDLGFIPIPCNFHNFYNFGGSFHCASLDIRRRGTLKSYF